MRAPLSVIMVGALMTLATTRAVAEQAHEVEQRWSNHEARWEYGIDRPDRHVAIALARGKVRIVRWARDRLEVRATAPDPENDGSAAAIVVKTDGRGLRIIDRYPPLPLGGTRECYPPDDEHGGAWVYDDVVSVTVFVPFGVEISVAGQ